MIGVLQPHVPLLLQHRVASGHAFVHVVVPHINTPPLPAVPPLPVPPLDGLPPVLGAPPVPGLPPVPDVPPAPDVETQTASLFVNPEKQVKSHCPSVLHERTPLGGAIEVHAEHVGDPQPLVGPQLTQTAPQSFWRNPQDPNVAPVPAMTPPPPVIPPAPMMPPLPIAAPAPAEPPLGPPPVSPALPGGPPSCSAPTT